MAHTTKPKFKLNLWGNEDRLEKKETSNLGEDPSLFKKMAQDAASIVKPADFLTQLLGIQGNEATHHADPEPEESHDHEPSKERSATIFSLHHLDRREGEHMIKRETQELIKEITQQVKLLKSEENKLEGELAKVTVDVNDTKEGIYYLRFFEWMLTVIKQLRVKVEESSSWLAEFSGRGKKKQGYWQSFKKHGTTFGMSHERSLATSAG